MTLKEEPRARRPSDFNDNLLKAVLEQNLRQSVERYNTCQSTVIRHLEKLGKFSKLGVWVPHNLSERNKEDHMSITTRLGFLLISTCLLCPGKITSLSVEEQTDLLGY
ncbi:histone-lysine N-methyltransferase SETMAR [Trichonephila inaurata madagascariensis]|uniref:Histone-lysine N-methyltransferase SETMAR n=1 Tax=Trichonephila inaurata madagascariensis TaxID=2747483 RepID=A0A8X7C2M8_9ARAC|nr:histone-lysine N-methyltransferase SETMAR [Trichonephila inaurata madagascariensis]